MGTGGNDRLGQTSKGSGFNPFELISVTSDVLLLMELDISRVEPSCIILCLAQLCGESMWSETDKVMSSLVKVSLGSSNNDGPQVDIFSSVNVALLSGTEVVCSSGGNLGWPRLTE